MLIVDNFSKSIVTVAKCQVSVVYPRLWQRQKEVSVFFLYLNFCKKCYWLIVFVSLEHVEIGYFYLHFIFNNKL